MVPFGDVVAGGLGRLSQGRMTRPRGNVLKIRTLAGAAVLSIAVGAVPAAPAAAHTTGIHDNCTKLHERWPHGVGTRKAKDKTSGTPVTNFTRNRDAYWRAENHNSDLDRDNDRIACEQT